MAGFRRGRDRRTVARERAAGRARPAKQTDRAARPERSGTADDAHAVAQILALDAACGRRAGRDLIRRELGCGASRAERLRGLADRADAGDGTTTGEEAA